MLYQLAGIVKLNQSLISGLIEVFIVVLVSVGQLGGFNGPTELSDSPVCSLLAA